MSHDNVRDRRNSDELALRRALKTLARDESPAAAVWAGIVARLPAQASASSLLAQRASWPVALVAALLLGSGLALLLPLWLHANAPGASDTIVLRRALYQLDTAQASLVNAQRLAPQAGYLTDLRVDLALQRAAIVSQLEGS